MNLFKHENQINDSELHFLLTGNAAVENFHTNPTIWLSSKSWDEICRLSKLENFKAIRKSLLDDMGSWQAIYNSEV